MHRRSLVALALPLLLSCTPAQEGAARPTLQPPLTVLRPPADEPIELAVTVDDLPHHGEEIASASRLEIHQRLLRSFAAHQLPPVYGFINARALEEHPEEDEALATWVRAGHPLGNHTYSHTDGAKATADEFLADVQKNEPVLARLMPGPPAAWRVFRYPYLREGVDVDRQRQLRAQIEQRGYRVAQVTVDFYDWAYQSAHERCLRKQDTAAIAGLRDSFLDQAVATLIAADMAARDLLGRPMRQILLLHAADFTSRMFDDLVRVYRARGVRFVSLGHAMADPAYERDPGVMPYGNFLWRLRKARGLRGPAAVPPQDTLLDLVCR